jgi:hypothetical protein
MTATASPLQVDTATEASRLRVTLLGIALAVVGVVMMGLTMLMTSPLAEGGRFRNAGDYLLAVTALPHGVGMFLTVLGFHRLQHGRDGRLGTVGVWLYGLCVIELVVQCMASVAAGSELIWGPLYPICAFGLMIALALLAAGSWSVGLLPRWMLGIWPPLGLVGSFLGVGPIPLVFAVFLLLMAVVLPRRIEELGARSAAR